MNAGMNGLNEMKHGRVFKTKAGKLGRYIYKRGKKVAFDTLIDTHNFVVFERKFRSAKTNNQKRQVIQELVKSGLISKKDAAAIYAAFAVAVAGSMYIEN